jgi:hypothetical protein
MFKFNNALIFISKIFREETEKIMLGRWTINYCPISIKKKIDSGNYDHCGECKFPESSKTKDLIVIKPIKDLE